MTTLVYKNKLLFSDSRAYAGNSNSSLPIGNKEKILKIKDPDNKYWYLGVSTVHPGLSKKLAKKFEELGIDMILDDEIDVHALAINSIGEIHYFAKGIAFTGPLQCKFIAIGSGDAYAYGAMANGANGYDAIKIAIEADVFSDLPIQQYDISDLQNH